MAFVCVLVLVVLGFASLCTSQVDCAIRNHCTECSEASACVWCKDPEICIPGDPRGPRDPGSCQGEWMWKQCSMDGQIIVWIVVGTVGGVILIATLAIWCCCHQRSKRKQAKLLDDYEKSYEEKDQKKKEHTESKWQSKRDEMRAKYGKIDGEGEEY